MHDLYASFIKALYGIITYIPIGFGASASRLLGSRNTGLATLPHSNDNNHQAFDKLFAFTNDSDEQLAVAEAAPGNPTYNGGRWDLQFATWLIANPPTVMSYAELGSYIADGFLVIIDGDAYFDCPLLPLKE